MRLIENLYDILSLDRDGGVIDASVALNPDSVIYRAHFPGQPVTPGVCIIQMAVELASDALGLPSLGLTGARNVKFLSVIEPDTCRVVKYHIEVTETGENEYRLSATVSAGDAVCAKLSLSCGTAS